MTNAAQTPPAKKTFVLGVGAQKSGTTWLRAYLNDSESCDFGIKKEHHVLDVHFAPHNMRYKKRSMDWWEKFAKAAEKTLYRFKGAPKAKVTRDLKMALFYYDIQEYYDYFCALAYRDPKIDVVGEITPAYAELPEEALRDVKAQMERRGFEVKILFLMRDPIERLHSLVRMRSREAQANGKSVKGSETKRFKQMLNSKKNHVRSRYELTIETLEKVFAPENIHYALYEEMFRDEQIKEITDFLGIAQHPAAFDVKKNATQKAEDLAPKVVKRARRKLRPTYKYVAAKFPNKDLKSIWKHM